MRNEDRYIEFDEYMASIDMEHQKNIRTESAIAHRKVASQRSKKLEKQRKREEFIHRLMRFLTIFAIAIVAYTLFNFTQGLIMSSQEMYFSNQSRYPKVSKTAMPVDEVEAWLDQFPQKRAENKPNGGIIRSVADIDQLYLREMSKAEQKAARAKAKREHKEALKNLAKQEAADAKEIAQQLNKWRKESIKEPTAQELAEQKEAKRLRRNELNRMRRKAQKKLKTVREMPTPQGQDILDKLKADGVYCVADWDKDRKSLTRFISEIRKLGYKLDHIKSGRAITHYTMNKQ